MAHDEGHTHTTLLELVDKAIKGGQAKIAESVAHELGENEVARRTSLLVAGVKKFQDLEAEVKKIRPQHTAFNAQGSPIGEPTFTKQQVDQLNKARGQIKKLEGHITKALQQGDYQGLDQLQKSGGKNLDDKEEGAQSSAG